MLRFKRKAQSTAEYAIVIALVIGAVVAMQVYVRRGIQSRMQGAVDNYLIGRTADGHADWGIQAGQGIPRQTGDGLYEPHMLERDITQTRHSPTFESVTDVTGAEGQVRRGIGELGDEDIPVLGEEVIDVTGAETYDAP